MSATSLVTCFPGEEKYYYTRHNKKWSVSEVISLQREYELLEWTVEQIAEKHQRTKRAIEFKINSEGFVQSITDNSIQDKT